MTTYQDRMNQEFLDYVGSVNCMNCKPLPGGITKAKADKLRRLLRYTQVARYGSSNI